MSAQAMAAKTVRLTPEQIARHAAVLATSRDREVLAASARSLASSGQPEALAPLGKLLQQREFLARLDALDEPQQKLTNLRHVLAALEAHPNRTTGELCEALAESPDFMAEPDRRIFLLPALAAARPLSERGEAIFRKANAEGYWSGNGPLLLMNGSPRALSLFATMIADAKVSDADRVDMIHWAVPPHRLQPGLARIARELIDQGLPPDVERALVETLFDYQGDEWFGVAGNAPVPPPWTTAATPVLQQHLGLGEHLLQARKPPPPLSATIERTLAEIRVILQARAK